ncbi:hypothetical protein [Sphingomonas sp. LY160]|uniref:hypothetical protein n=1 Tax=Sphingomonas sp. LY160 TaxID=3095342 RepID=UPI002ADECFCB|nr:hypothetical protein [Sphingomonas sp. LY160]MEA1073312.1 hypothetical protein [Sphingomonas sp. LY160]
MPRLKLFKATSGFHDSYVAATSRSAALKAWGARTDLFAMGAAEQADDDAILAEASESPGTVLQKRRIKGAELEKRAVPRKAKDDRAKRKRALATSERKLTAAEAAPDADLAKRDAAINRLARSRQEAETKHEAAIKRLREDLAAAQVRLE